MKLIQSLFLWFYSLSIPKTILIVLLVTGGFVYLRKCWGASRYWKITIWLGTFIWIGIIFAVTTYERTVNLTTAAPMLTPFHSYAAVLRGETAEILRSNFMNILLFYPVGLILVSGLPRRWKYWQQLLLIAMLSIVVSTWIEFCQYYYCLGVSEIDDVIHNTLGAVLGALFSAIWR